MPAVESYVAEVTVSVVLKSTTAGRVSEYAVTRVAKGSSIEAGEELSDMSGAVRVLEAALVDAVSAHHALAHGVQNAERKRLK